MDKTTPPLVTSVRRPSYPPAFGSPFQETCSACQGELPAKKNCPACRGTGKAQSRQAALGNSEVELD